MCSTHKPQALSKHCYCLGDRGISNHSPGEHKSGDSFQTAGWDGVRGGGAHVCMLSGAREGDLGQLLWL